MAVDQMQSLKAQYGVTTKRDLVRAIADEFALETGERRSVVMAEVMLDGMLEAEYQRIEGGAYDMPDLDRLTDGDETGYTMSPAKVLRDVRKTDEDGFDADLAYEQWLENQGQDE
ncbi:MAG: hypothetical protein ACOYB2_10890 [Limnohabitans sp.]